jgi:hypothetical protein
MRPHEGPTVQALDSDVGWVVTRRNPRRVTTSLPDLAVPGADGERIGFKTNRSGAVDQCILFVETP